MKAANERYYYMDEFNYECAFGYRKIENGLIECQANKTWTSTPNCTLTGE